MATERKQELGALLQPCYSSIQVTRKEKLFSHPCISSVLLMFYPIHIENSLQFMSDISLWIFVSYPLFITDSVMNTLPPMLWYSTHHLLSLFQERYTAATAACWTITVTDIWKRWYKTYSNKKLPDSMFICLLDNFYLSVCHYFRKSNCVSSSYLSCMCNSKNQLLKFS